jgi:hypothetical protein
LVSLTDVDKDRHETTSRTRDYEPLVIEVLLDPPEPFS